MFISLRAARHGLALLLMCARVLAEQTSELLPPVVQSSTDVPYPEGAEGDTEVVLELVVEKDGSVSSATVIEGIEPFAERARSAVLAWHFTPAQRDHQPVAARIRARVAFQREPESPVPPPQVNPAPSPVAPIAAPPQAPAEEPYEITVVGRRREIGQTTLSQRDVRELPGAFGDAFRAIEALPGVTPLVSGIPYFYVRGAPPNNAGYYLDGIRVPLLFHLGIGQSVIHPGLVDRVDFFPSAAPARHGGFAGPVIAGQTRAPATELHGEANLRLVDVGALLEAPLAGARGSALVAGRYGYPGPVVSAFTDDVKIGYWDYQMRVSWQLGPRDSVSVFGFGSHDYLASGRASGGSNPRELIEQFVSDVHRIDLRYDHALSDGRVRFALTGGYDSQGAAPTYVTDRSLGARLEVEQDLGQTLRLRGGADARLDHYQSEIGEQNPREPAVSQSFDPPPTNIGAGLYMDFVWRPTPGVELVPGGRFDVYASSRPNEPPSTTRARTIVPAVDPRLSARVTLSPGVVWLSALGLSHQYPSLRVGNIPAPIFTIPGFPFDVRQLQTAAQASQGVELALPASLTLTATGFYSSSWGVTDLSADCFQFHPSDVGPPMPGEPEPPFVCPNDEPVRGRAYGLELLLRRPFSERLSGLLSYTLSRSTQRAHFLTPAGAEDVATVASAYDRTHVLNAILSYDLGRRWRVGTRLLFYTGMPYSQLDGSLPVPPYNAYRHPAFYRLDFRLEKRWRLGQAGSLAFVLEGQNITLRKEKALGLDCIGRGTPQSETTTCETSTIGPVTIPSVGVEAFF